MTPGSGTKLRKRNTISAPMVNQMRCLSSVALQKLARLRLLAMLSARDAIGVPRMPCLARAGPCPARRQPLHRERAGSACRTPLRPLSRVTAALRLLALPCWPCARAVFFSCSGWAASITSTEPPAFSTASQRALGGAGDLEADLGGELALAEQAHAVLAAARQGPRLERGLVDHALASSLPASIELLDQAEVDLGVILGERCC